MTPDHKTTIGAILAAIFIFVGVVVTVDKFFGDNKRVQSDDNHKREHNNYAKEKS